MIQELHDAQVLSGATFDEENRAPTSFGNDAQAWRAAQEGVAVCDRSHWGLIKLTGVDCLRFLNNQSTNDFNRLQPGQGCHTVFTNATGRMIELATAYVTEEAVFLLVSPSRRQQLLEWLDRFLFPMDRVELADVSEANAVFSLIGLESDTVLKESGVEEIAAQPEGTHKLVQIADIPVRVAVGSGLAMPGYTLIVSAEQAAALWEQITTSGAVAMGDRLWETLRIQQGRPAPDRELTEDYNPLEAGLWQSISFEKGCYIGQETIARLNTYKGVKQQLWGVRLSAPAEPETPIMAEGKKVGKLTSYTETEQGWFGLAYVRSKAGGAGLKVQLGSAEGELVDVPFLTHEYYQPARK